MRNIGGLFIVSYTPIALTAFLVDLTLLEGPPMAEPPPWRIHVTAALVHPSEDAVWLADAAGPVLRVDFESPTWFPDVAPVLAAVRERWELDAVVLRCLEAREDRDTRQDWVTYLLLPRSAALPAHGRWVPVRDLANFGPPPESGDDVLVAALHGLTAPPPSTRAPWSERGWVAAAEEWIAAALRDAGLGQGRPPEQQRTWGLSTVWRCETPDGDVYFKAAAHHSTGRGARSGRGILFANEAALLTGLAQRFPDDVPRPIATNPQRVWMLLPDAGPALAESDDLVVWEAVLRGHARHQRAYVAQESELFRIGCLDRRLDRLAADLEDLATDEVALAFCEPQHRERLRSGLPALRALIAEAAALGIPDTLVHGDFHSGNVGLREGRAVVYDWTDAYVGQPLLDLVTFLDESQMLDAAPGARERLRAAYLSEWHGVATEEALARAAELAKPLGMLHQAVSYQYMLPNLEEPTRSAMGRAGAYWMERLLDWLG